MTYLGVSVTRETTGSRRRRVFPDRRASLPGMADRRHAREAAIVGLVALGYTLLRWISTPEEAGPAVANAWEVVALERALGLYVEAAIQDLLLVDRVVVAFFNGYYVLLHLPPIAGATWYVYRHRPEAWPTYRDAMVGFTLLGLVVHAIYPVAPPWFVEETGIRDTFGIDRAEERAASVGNPFAAMPSMHIGWATLGGLAVVLWARAPLLRGLGLAHPPLMALSTVVTGNHFLLDGLAALLLVALAVLGAAIIHRRRRARAERARRARRPEASLGT